MTTMMLHAAELNFTHPVTEQNLIIKAELSPQMYDTLKILGFTNITF